MGGGSPLGTISGSGCGSCGVVVMPTGTRAGDPGTGATMNEDDSKETGGQFQRDTAYIADRITRDGRRPEHDQPPGQQRLVDDLQPAVPPVDGAA